MTSTGEKQIRKLLALYNSKPFPYQLQAWDAIAAGQSGLINAPTGTGKTYAAFLGFLIRYINQNPQHYKSTKNIGLQLLWISPLRALAKDIGRAMEEVITALELPWQVSIRNGDTAASERTAQKKKPPQILITTPESLHLLLSQKNHAAFFDPLQMIVVDEWHDLLGTKRAVQVELAISRLVALQQTRLTKQKPNPICVWGLSATIGNLQEAADVLLAAIPQKGLLIKAQLQKKWAIRSILPPSIETYPWAGHLGLKLAHNVLPLLQQHNTTLLFINTRGMSERWYQQLLHLDPSLAGVLALHHGSIDMPLRIWVEEALHTGVLRAVVCTSSLDLGVDFRPVDTVVQVGSPKGVARFLQRAGRSGHRPNAESSIYFLPTHSLELMEVAALRQASRDNIIESRIPLTLCFDVLLQYLCTLAVGDGFDAEQLFKEVKNTFCFREITPSDWNEVLLFLTRGGVALQQYDEFKKVEQIDGLYKITGRQIAMRHRLHIGTIVSSPMLRVQLQGGGSIGVIEEYFISRLQTGDVFTLAGRNLELIGIRDMTVLTKKSNAIKSIVPSWDGGRMPLSACLGAMLRKKLSEVAGANAQSEPELYALKPLFALQKKLSHVPLQQELLIEHIETDDGHHLFVYPFEGRLVHEAMAALLAYRISQMLPISFSIAMNDYGFELLSDQAIPVNDENVLGLFSEADLFAHINKAVNATEMARRKFRDIAVIGGLIFPGMPGQKTKARHLQSSASLLFNVLSEYEPGNLLLRQAYNEVMEQQMDEPRLRAALQRIQNGKIIIRHPAQLTPFCFPIKVDSMRESLSSEKLEDRIIKMQSGLR